MTATVLDESRYLGLVERAFRRIEDALDRADSSDVELDTAGDVLTLQLRNGVRCVINTQRPTRQIWVAARANAWHFSYDEPSGTWVQDRGSERSELFSTLSAIVREHAGLTLSF